mmetsp:Transcript_17489/g.12517  ORF Transcript_17489/g.12517 Transcript_17489/m.12517 type:complete len:210 (-) Transcript_17489:47-676(-)
MFIKMLESISSTLLEPDFEVSGMRQQSTVVSAVSINMESSHHTQLEFFIEDVDVRETERFPHDHGRVSVDNDKSLCSKAKMSVASEISTTSYMNVEFDVVSSDEELFVHISDRHELSIYATIKSHSITHLLLLHSHSRVWLHHRLSHRLGHRLSHRLGHRLGHRLSHWLCHRLNHWLLHLLLYLSLSNFLLLDLLYWCSHWHGTAIHVK